MKKKQENNEMEDHIVSIKKTYTEEDKVKNQKKCILVLG